VKIQPSNDGHDNPFRFEDDNATIIRPIETAALHMPSSSPSKPPSCNGSTLFFISLATRRIEYLACTSNPDGRWTAQQARNLVMQLGDQQPIRFLIHDRDSKFSRDFDEILRTDGIEVIRTPTQAPNANAFAERWVRTVRADCLDRIPHPRTPPPRTRPPRLPHPLQRTQATSGLAAPAAQRPRPDATQLGLPPKPT
jgi:hypothetical protein